VAPMVVWSEPKHPLETAADSPRKRSKLRSGGFIRRRCEPTVRDQGERVKGMKRREIGQWCKVPSAHWARAATGLSLLLAFVLLAGAAHAQSASAWNKRGQQAEAREDYDAAFEAYRQAWLKKPSELAYKERYERLRFQSANQHVDRGRVLRQSGDVGGAINEFARALQIDPGNQAAAQELELTQKPITPGGRPQASAAQAVGGGINNQALSNAGPEAKVLVPGVDEETPHQRDVRREIESLSAPPRLQPVSNDPITLHMVEDTKNIYTAIGKAAGLNVIFDPKYNSTRIPVDLTNVSLFDALRMVGILSKTFWRPVTSNTIYVTEDNPNNRTEQSEQAVQTFYLTNVSQQNDANEILIALRNLLDQRAKLYLIASQNAIVLRASPDELVLAEKIINDLDRTKPEVVVDVAVLEVSRNFERNIGITLPQSVGLTPVATGSTGATTTSSGSTTTTGGTTTTNNTTNLTLNTLANANATNFAVTVTGGQVNALLTDANTRILQNPRIRATDGQRATLKIGSKIPVATGSYNAGVSAGIASLGVQTQFQYLDVGVNIDMTPTVHYDREISLKMKVEVSAQTSSVTISGVTEPILSQRSAEQTIELKDGEPSLLAGILTNQDQYNVSGTPGLGELPILKYFFASHDKIQQKDEIVFLIIPHIVRDSILTDENTRAIYAGTGQTVELIRKGPEASSGSPQASNAVYTPTPSSSTTAANAAAAMIPHIAAAGQPLPPPPGADASVAPTPGNIPSTTAVTPLNLSVVSPAQTQVGATFQVTVRATNAHDLFGVPLQMQFDPKVLSLVGVDAGDLLGKDGQAVALSHRDDGEGAVTMSLARPPNTAGVNGDGPLCVLTFKAIAPGSSTLALVRVAAQDSHQNKLPAVGGQATVRVTAGGPAPN
jgi:general secretion pathway protein D